MLNIFKTFKENQRLMKENELLKVQNEALTEFRKGFDKFYNDIAGVKLIARNYDKRVVLRASVSMDRQYMHYPTDVCKEYIVKELSKQLLPLIEYDIADNEAYGTKDIVGTLTIFTR